MSLNKSEFRKLIELGKKKGFLTYDEINDALPNEGFSANDVDNLLKMLDDMGIEVVEGADKALSAEEPAKEKHAAPYKKGDFIGEKYEVYDVLGMGGFGVVYLVYYHESVFALKTFREEYLWDREAQERFKKEAKIWIDLERHPYLVQAYLVQEISGRLFIAIEYIAPDEDGLNSLDGYLRHKPPDLAQSLRWGIQFCHGMEYAYSKGIRAHRDIKPANIMIGQDKTFADWFGQDKTLKITDFGLAGVIGQARISGIRMDIHNNTVGFSCQTVEGNGFGTPTHMPPEQFTNAVSCDERSDIYSFGIVLYQMATGGALPFLPELPRDNSDEEYIRFWGDIHRLHSSAPVPRMNSPLFPIIQRCLEKEPKKRYQSFADLRLELEPLLKKLTGEVIKAPERKELGAAGWVIKGFSLGTLGKYQEAIECYDRAIEINPRYAEAWSNKGNALSGLGRHEEAIECYDRALGIDPRLAEAWYNKGVTLSGLGKYQDAIVCYDRALEINPIFMQAWSNKGNALSGLGRHQEAIGCYDRALEINPIFMQAWSNKGNALSGLGRHEEAIECYDRALGIDPRLAEAWGSKGNALFGLGRHQEAIICCDKALEINPRYAGAWYNKGAVLSGLGKYQEAIECYDRAIEINPRYAEAWHNKGSALGNLGKYQDAIVCYDRAIEINPRLAAEAWFGKGLGLNRLGRHKEAIEAYENYIKLAPSYDTDRVAKVKAFIQELKAKTGK